MQFYATQADKTELMNTLELLEKENGLYFWKYHILGSPMWSIYSNN